MIIQPTDQTVIFIKKETFDLLFSYLKSKDDRVTTYDDVIQEWVNWQIKADEETPEQHS